MFYTDAVSVPGWTGAGYIISDPQTGDGAYLISGGGNGSHFIVGFFYGISIGYASIYVGEAWNVNAKAQSIAGLAILLEIILLAYITYESYGYIYGSLAQQCFLTGLGLGLTSSAAVIVDFNKLIKIQNTKTLPVTGGGFTVFLGLVIQTVTNYSTRNNWGQIQIKVKQLFNLYLTPSYFLQNAQTQAQLQLENGSFEK